MSTVFISLIFLCCKVLVRVVDNPLVCIKNLCVGFLIPINTCNTVVRVCEEIIVLVVIEVLMIVCAVVLLNIGGETLLHI